MQQSSPQIQLRRAGAFTALESLVVLLIITVLVMVLIALSKKGFAPTTDEPAPPAKEETPAVQEAEGSGVPVSDEP